MAKKSKIAKNLKITAKKHKIELLPEKKQNRVSTRAINRCKICGRPRAYIRHFGVCRLCFRELAARGELAGVTKASK